MNHTVRAAVDLIPGDVLHDGAKVTQVISGFEGNVDVYTMRGRFRLGRGALVVMQSVQSIRSIVAEVG